MLDAVGTALTAVFGWIGTFINELTTASTGKLVELLPLFAVGIAISAIMLGIRIVKSVVWGE